MSAFSTIEALLRNLVQVAQGIQRAIASAAPITSSQPANEVLASPNGTAGVPGFRALVTPDLAAVTLPIANGGTGASSAAAALAALGAAALAQFISSRGTSGYYEWPDGTILNWVELASVTLTAGSFNYFTFNWSKPFPNGVVNFLAGSGQFPGGPTSFISVDLESVINAGGTFVATTNNNQSGVNLHAWAIGY